MAVELDWVIPLPKQLDAWVAKASARYQMSFLLGIGAAHKAAAKSTDGKSTDRRYHVVSIVVVILLALLIFGLLVLVVGMEV